MTSLGVKLEQHSYLTEDGYINTVFRIPPALSDPIGVVVYQHGLFDACETVIAQGEKSLGIKLVKAGYELWLNNHRGNRFSR